MRRFLNVITNAVNIGMELSNQAALNVTLTGGAMRWAGAFSLIGPTAMETLSGVFFDKVFIGAGETSHLGQWQPVAGSS